MPKIKLLAAAALATTLAASFAAPASAQYARHWDRDVGPGAVAAGIAGAAIGTAGAIASAPFRDSYAYYGDDGYAPGYSYGGGYGYRNRYRSGNTWGSDAGAGGYNTDAGRPDYNW